MHPKLYNIEELRCGAFLKAGKMFDMIRYESFMGQTNGFRFPHQHNYYMILIVTNGSGSQFIDFKEYPIIPSSIFLLYPGMIHEWGEDKDMEGYLIFFTEEFFTQRYHENSLSKFHFFSSLTQPPFITIPTEKFNLIYQICDFMLDTYEQSNTYNMVSALRSYLNILLIECEKYCNTIKNDNIDQVPEQVIYQRKIISQFEQLVNQNFKQKHLVKDYAIELLITANYLNVVCKQLRGISAGNIIRERIILEAKRMLHQENLTVSQIAFDLNFNDHSYFSKFFKKYTGITPNQFRKKMNR